MAGFRIIAIVVGLLMLATAAAMFFHDQPIVVNFSKYLLKEPALERFVKSADPEDLVVKNHLKYALCGGSVIALGIGLLFIISAFAPIRMRPFVVVMIIISIIWIPLAIWVGSQLKVIKLWWIGDAVSGLVLAVLLISFFPRKVKKEQPASPSSAVLEE